MPARELHTNKKSGVNDVSENAALAVVLIENRFDCSEIMDRHLKYLPEDSVTYISTMVNSVERYNRLLASVDFWKQIKEENILIIQHDSALLKQGITSFYKWDYVGAPWTFQQHGGNGGLSFRKKSAMIECIEKISYNGTDNEDIYFCNALKTLGKNLAPRDVCEMFSCEAIFKLGTLGYHAIEKWLTPDQCEQIKNQYK